MDKLKLFITLAIFPLIFFVGCDEDNDGNNPPTTGTLTGTVVFHGEWPAEGHIQLSIFTSWNYEGTNCYWCAQSAGGPPAYTTPTTHFQDPDPGNPDPDTLTFEITGISLGTYETVVTGWRDPTPVGNVECDEPVIGMLGANPGTNDTIPASITFDENNPTQIIELHTWFDLRLPVPGCNNLGRIDGTIDFTGDRPEQGIAVMISVQPWTAWQDGTGGYRGRYAITDPNSDYFSFSQSYGTYYISLWTNDAPPNNVYLGAWGVNTIGNTGTDAHTDGVILSEATPLVTLDAVAGLNPSHYVSGNITFNGTRPVEGLAIALSLTPTLMGPPTGWFVIADEMETLYAITGMPEGTYYVLLYKNVPGSPDATLYGIYDADNDGTPDPVVISSENWGFSTIDITGTTP